MNWKLVTVTDTDWIQDNSGYYTLIHYVKDNIVRLDWMDSKDNMPVISFQGTAGNVRKYSVRIQIGAKSISREHAAYIGAELARCELLKTDYVQD